MCDGGVRREAQPQVRAASGAQRGGVALEPAHPAATTTPVRHPALRPGTVPAQRSPRAPTSQRPHRQPLYQPHRQPLAFPIANRTPTPQLPHVRSPVRDRDRRPPGRPAVCRTLVAASPPRDHPTVAHAEPTVRTTVTVGSNARKKRRGPYSVRCVAAPQFAVMKGHAVRFQHLNELSGPVRVEEM